MMKSTRLWKRRMVLLLAAALLAGEISSVSMVPAAASETGNAGAESNTESSTETLPVPEEYYTLGGEDTAAPVIKKEDNGTDIGADTAASEEEIPVLSPTTPENLAKAKGEAQNGAQASQQDQQSQQNQQDQAPQAEFVMASEDVGADAAVDDISGDAAGENTVSVNAILLNTPYTLEPTVNGANETKYFSFSVSENGYYAFVLETDTYTSFDCVTTLNGQSYAKGQLQKNIPYVDYYTQGETYQIAISGTFWGDTSCKLTLKKVDSVLEIKDGKVSGTVSDMAVVPLNFDTDGRVYLFHRAGSNTEYKYRLISEGTSMYEGTLWDGYSASVLFSKSREDFWLITKATETEEQINGQVSFVPLVEFGSSASQQTEKAYVFGDSNATTKRILVSYKPKETGEYYFQSNLSGGTGRAIEIGEILRDANNRITGEKSVQGFSRSDFAAVATLESGKEYYYEVSASAYTWNEPIPDEATISVQKKNASEVTLATDTTLDITGGGQLFTFDSEKGKFYRLSLKSSYSDDKYAFVISSGGNSSQVVNYASFSSEQTTILYAYGDTVGIFIEKDTTNGWTGAVTLRVDEYVPTSLTLGRPASNGNVLQSMEPHVVSFTPDKSGTYSVWGIDYSGHGFNQDAFVITEYGWLSTIPDVNDSYSNYYSDYFDRQYDLTAGETYYFYQYSYGQTGVDEYLICVDEAKTYKYDFSRGNTAEFAIGLNKSAKVDLTVPENGFYEIVTEGDADNYQITDGNDMRFTVYNEQPKTFYMDSDGTYTLQISREFKKEYALDNMKLTIRKVAALEEVPVYNSNTELKAGKGVAVSLRESEDFQWLLLKAPSDGYYKVTTEYPYVGEDEDEWSSVYTQAYRITDGKLVRLNYDEYNSSRKKMTEGEELYLKVTTEYEGADASIKVLKYRDATVNAGETITVEDMDGYLFLNTNIPESGFYEVALSKSDTDTWAYYESDYAEEEFTDSVKFTTYMKAGDNEAIISCKDEKLTVSVTKKASIELAKTIELSYDTNLIWVKYIPEKSEEQLVGFKNTNEYLDTTGISVYQLSKNADSINRVKSTSVHDNGISYRRCKFTAGETYYFKLTFDYWGDKEEEISPLTVFVQKMVYATTDVGKAVEITTDKFAQITLANEEGSGYSRGWYQVSISGNDTDICTSMHVLIDEEDEDSYDVEEVIKPNSDAVFLVEGTANLSIFLSRQDSDYAEDTFAVTITPYKEESLKTFTVGENVANTAKTNMECYTFKVPADGRYQLEATGIFSLYYQNKEGKYNVWWSYDDQEFQADEEILLYVPNKKGTKYELNIFQIKSRVLYDADQYAAFLASGGTVNVKTYAEFTEEEKERYEYDDEDMFTYMGDHKYIITDVSGFKNKNDIWYLDYLRYAYFDVSQDTYGDYTEWAKEYADGWKFTGFYKTNGQKASETEKLDDAFLLAKYVPYYVWVQEITITGVNALKVGQSATLTANLNTKNQYTPTNASVTWSSSDSSVVSVDQNGKMTAKKAGTAVITVKSKDQLGASASLKVTVSQDVVYVEKVTITGENKVYVGDAIQLQAALDTNGKGKPSRDGVTWSTSDANVATVDANGKVTGISAGTVTITAASNDGKAKATYTVTVENVVEKKISLNESKITMKKGTTYKWLEVTFKPANTTDKTLKWKSSNTKVATVNSKGIITAKGIGNATITVTSANGKKDTVKVTVTNSSIKVKKITLKKKLTMNLGDKENLKPEFEPVNATNQKLTWESSNEKVATINSKGQVTAVGEGKAKITCTAKDGSKEKATCSITVKGVGKLKISQVTSASKGEATITWEALKDVDGYEVYMATSKKGTYNKIATVNSNKTSFTKKKLKKGTKYYFKVRAYKKVSGKKVYGDYSSVKSVKTKK